MSKRARVAILGEREIFGEEEIVTLEKRKYTVTCISSDFQVYTIEKEVRISHYSYIKIMNFFIVIDIIIKK